MGRNSKYGYDRFLLTLTLENKKSTYKFDDQIIIVPGCDDYIEEQEQVKNFGILIELTASTLIPRVCLFVGERCHPILFNNLKNMKKLKEVKIFNYNFYDFFYSKYLFQKNLEILEIEDDFVILTRQTRLKFF